MIDFDFTMCPADPDFDLEADERRFEELNSAENVASARPLRVGDVIGTTDDGRLRVVWRTVR